MIALLSLLGLAFAGMALVPTGTSVAEDGDEVGYPDDPERPVDLVTDGDDADPDTGADPEPVDDGDQDPDTDPATDPDTGVDDGGENGGTDDIMQGTDGRDYLDGQDGDDAIYGGGGADELHGNAGDDLLDGGDGADSLYGHIGDDSLSGGDGDDELIGGDGADQLDGGSGDDSLLGSVGDDVLTGGAGADVLNGGDGNDMLHGSDTGSDARLDYLNGAEGDDTLYAGALDNLHGGNGSDIFAFDMDQADQGAANVEDFDAETDTLVVLYDGTMPEPDLTMSVTEAGTSLLANGQAIAFVQGVQMIDLDAVQLIAA